MRGGRGSGSRSVVVVVLGLAGCASAPRDPLAPAPANAIEPVTAIERALPVGARAPAFTATDSEGRDRALETLCGPNGVVLLFFRSADW